MFSKVLGRANSAVGAVFLQHDIEGEYLQWEQCPVVVKYFRSR